jgi:hypothetical protein
MPKALHHYKTYPRLGKCITHSSKKTTMFQIARIHSLRWFSIAVWMFFPPVEVLSHIAFANLHLFNESVSVMDRIYDMTIMYHMSS